MRKLFRQVIYIYIITIIILFAILPRYDVYMTMPLDSISITSDYGRRWGTFHRGIDFAADRGDNVYSACAGKVIKAEESGSYGQLAVIKCSGSIKTYYAHLDSLNVKKGENVHRGQTIGTVGSSGNATGPHLHFEVRYKGQAKNPAQFIDKIGTV